MTEPLADGRDEVIYMICSHERIAFGQKVDEEGRHAVYAATGGLGGPFDYDMSSPWAHVRFPDEVGPSKLGWAVIDPLLESVEGLVPDTSFDPVTDPEGDVGRHRHELLPWIYDRHLELDKELEVDRGDVQGGEINFVLEYIGKAGNDALLRASGAHHKLSLILARTLAYDPARLVYTLPCNIHALRVESDQARAQIVELARLADAVDQTGIPRELLIAVAEEALIAAVGAWENHRNTRTRLFPQSDAGDRLAAAGIDRVAITFGGIPERMTITGRHRAISRDDNSLDFRLTPG
jgi:hypothetical protein